MILHRPPLSPELSGCWSTTLSFIKAKNPRLSTQGAHPSPRARLSSGLKDTMDQRVQCVVNNGE